MDFWESPFFHKLLETMPFGIILLNAEGHAAKTNRIFTAMTGYGHSDIQDGEAWFQVAYPDADYREQVRACWFMDWELPISQRTFEIVCKNGQRKWIRFHVFHVDRDHTILLLEDITREKLTADLLWESQARFRDLIETVRDFIWETNAEGCCTYASPSVLQLLGYRPDEVLGRRPFDFMIVADRERICALFEAKQVLREPFGPLEYTCRHKNGQAIILESSGVPYFNQNGRFMGYRGVDRDVTGRKAAEEYSQRRRRYLNQAQRMIQLGSWDWDLRKKENHWSEEMNRILGYTPGEIQPSTAAFFDRVHPEDRDWLRREYDKLLDNQEIGDKEFRIINGRGDVRTVFCRCHEERDERGQLILLQGVFLDITQQKQTELRLRELVQQQEHIVAERTASLTRLNEQLQQEVAERKTAERTLASKTHTLEEINATLRVLLQQQDKIRSEIANNVLANLKEFVQPYLCKLRETGLSMVQSQYLDIITSNLNNVASPFLNHLAIEYVLTPKELQVAGLIRDGRSSKDISKIMHCSRSTIDFHRNSIRVKLGINKKRANLKNRLIALK